jgi:hypothetical protein
MKRGPLPQHSHDAHIHTLPNTNNTIRTLFGLLLVAAGKYTTFGWSSCVIAGLEGMREIKEKQKGHRTIHRTEEE